MTALVCNAINEELVKDYLDSSMKHGLVFAATTEKNGKKITFPLDYGSQENNFEKAVLPDPKKMTVSYFESNAATRTNGDNGTYTGFLSLVVWMNTALIDQSNSCVSDIIAADLERALKSIRAKTFDGGKIINIRTNYIHGRNQNIFSRYTYEELSKFLQAPYDAIKIDFEVNFSYSCADITINPKSC